MPPPHYITAFWQIELCGTRQFRAFLAPSMRKPTTNAQGTGAEALAPVRLGESGR
jgi:hypothetical protein